MAKRIYFFEEGEGRDKRLLGGKGAGLCEMTQQGLPVPPGFIVTTEACLQYYENRGRLPEGLMQEVKQAMKRLEDLTGKGFGDPNNPLLVSVRSGAAVSMPGMMDTVLNLGLNDETTKGLMSQTGDERFAYDAYRRFLQLFGKVVLGVRGELFSRELEEAKKGKGLKFDHELDSGSLKGLAHKFKEICSRETGLAFPEDPYIQLEGAIAAVFRSWSGKRCVDYRREFKITPDVANGTAAIIVGMVFGNMGAESGTGVVFTRDPATGEKRLYGDYLINAQGEDLVSGSRTPKPIQRLEEDMSEAYRSLVEIGEKLERHFREPQDIEFTVERGRLFVLQTRDAKMNVLATVRTSVEMVKEGLISKEEAILRVRPEDLEQLLHRRVDPSSKERPLATGIPASPGAATGAAVFDADEAERKGRAGERVILVREETKPEDVHGFFAAQGILTSRGGKSSHAAIVARGMGRPCVVGCSEIHIDIAKRCFKVGTFAVKEGDVITVDGSTGHIFLGEVPTIEPELSREFTELLSWADEFRKLGIRANVDTPEGALLARSLGAEGIGLCRTERMFNATDRLPTAVRMILAEEEAERRRALKELMPLQKEDFKAILKAMEGCPVAIRLLDPPLHEFLPRAEELLQEIHALKASRAPEAMIALKQKALQKARALAEVNPMLGHRGVRVGVTHPEIYEMQIRAIYEATAELLKEGIDVRPQIMVPQVCEAEELLAVKRIVEKVKGEVEENYGLTITIKFGTMIEAVRACLQAERTSTIVDFFSFGTNDLTQATFSFSREDAESKFLPFYTASGILRENPFHKLDVEGVGRLMKMAVEEGRGAKPELEIGICGEHGGEPNSIDFCHRIGLTYVSCSPYRLPVARLSAARSALQDMMKPQL